MTFTALQERKLKESAFTETYRVLSLSCKTSDGQWLTDN